MNEGDRRYADRLDRRLAGIDGRLAGIDGRLNAHSRMLERVDSASAALATDVALLKKDAQSEGRKSGSRWGALVGGLVVAIYTALKELGAG